MSRAHFGTKVTKSHSLFLEIRPLKDISGDGSGTGRAFVTFPLYFSHLAIKISVKIVDVLLTNILTPIFGPTGPF